MRWYASLVIICILGVATVVYSRYERQHPSSAGQPTLNTQWFAGFDFDICGVTEPNLPANPSTKVVTGYTTAGDGVIHIDPTKSDETGANATLGRFVQGYKGLVLSPVEVEYPGKKSATVGRLFSNGDKCTKGTPYAGKVGTLQVKEWPTFLETAKPQVVNNPDTLRLANEQLITIAFIPYGATISRPPATVSKSLLTDVSNAQQEQQATASTVVPTTATPQTQVVKVGTTVATSKSGSTKS
jgi:hypothetical protein